MRFEHRLAWSIRLKGEVVPFVIATQDKSESIFFTRHLWIPDQVRDDAVLVDEHEI